jgi:molecular chaperone DnaK (HSP70)
MPSSFSEACCDDLRNAIQAALPQWQAVSIIRDLEAAALAYAYTHPNNTGSRASTRRLFIVDFGAGSTDVGVVDIHDPASPAIVKVMGDPTLGGRDLDIQLANWIVTQHLEQSLSSLAHDNRVRVRSILLERCRAAKEALSFEMSTKINLEFPRYRIAARDISITRKEFEGIGSHIWRRVAHLVKQVIDESQQNLSELDDVLLLGGSCRIPRVKRSIKALISIALMCLSLP